MKLLLILVVILAVNGGRNSHICTGFTYWTGQTCMPCQSQCECSSYLGCSSYVDCGPYQIQVIVNKQAYCYDCPAGCEYCTLTGTNGFKCSKCLSAYQLLRGICIPQNPKYSFNIQQAQNSFAAPQLWDVPTVDSIWLTMDQQYFINTVPCDLDSNVQCSSCATGSFMNEVNQCEVCMSNCDTCTARDICTSCSNGYYWKPNFTQVNVLGQGSGGCAPCQSLFSNSLTCSISAALTCTSGYYLTTATCTACTQPNCNTCNSTGCLTCVAGTYYKSSQCNYCFGNSATVTACASCSSSTNCSTCATGYVFVGSVCQLCNFVGCQTCGSKNNQLICSVCQNGYYMGPGSICVACTSASPYYTLCTNSDEGAATATVTPTQCQTGYAYPFNVLNYMLVTSSTSSTTYTCVANKNHCLQMINSDGNCSTCATGYALILGACQLCSTVSNCINCTTGTQQPTCTQCAVNYYVSAGICTPCSNGCTTCSGSGCSTCLTGYQLNSGVCTQCSVQYCATCPTTTTVCATCQSQFFLYTPTVAGQVAQCVICPPGCLDCQASQGQSCTTCLSGFYKQGTGCYPGSQYCAVLNSDGSCKQCQYGAYYVNGSCLPCISYGGGYICSSTSGLALVFSVLALFII